MAVARTIAQRSLCSRDQVGAVVVSASNRLLETGYNGPPAGWTREVGGVTAQHLGCEFWCPRAMKRPGDPARPGELFNADYSDCPSLHAEANALMFGDRSLREGGTIYISSEVCSACAKLIANSGLVQVVFCESLRPGGVAHRNPETWIEFMENSGLEVRPYVVAER